jgi:hypothetical protein
MSGNDYETLKETQKETQKEREWKKGVRKHFFVFCNHEERIVKTNELLYLKHFANSEYKGHREQKSAVIKNKRFEIPFFVFYHAHVRSKHNIGFRFLSF